MKPIAWATQAQRKRETLSPAHALTYQEDMEGHIAWQLQQNAQDATVNSQ